MPRKTSKPVAERRTGITITSIAKELDLSVATVSYVINGKTAENGISEKTANRVRKAARELGYVPNDLARSLRRQRTESIGVILSDLEQGWAHHTLKGILSVLDPENYVPYISVHFWDPEREKRELRSMLKRRMEAIITVPMSENVAEYKMLVEQGMPLLFLQDELEDCPEVSFAMWDARESAMACVKHLISQGRRRIGFIGANHFTPWMKMRFQGYQQALKEARLEYRDQWACLEPRLALSTRPSTEADFGSTIRKLLDNDKVELPDAFLVMNDAVGLTALHVLQDEYGYRVPEDFAVMGMGNLSSSALLSLSSAHEPIEEVGVRAAEVALELIRGSGRRIEALVPCNRLHIRHSTDPAKKPGTTIKRRKRYVVA